MSINRVAQPVSSRPASSLLVSVAVPSAAVVSSRHVSGFNFFQGPNRWKFPGGGEPIVSKHQIESMQFHPKSREQWDYKGINERIDAQSEFRNLDNRPDFGGPRPDNWTCFEGSLHNAPHWKKLHEYFDEYTKPGTDPKINAIKAVQEHWDAANFYYPGETWQRNRPSFRSVPAEILNKQTWYHWIDMATKLNEMFATSRPRAWNPVWPPPGYKKPPFWTKREFTFGVEEPGLLSEVERWYWFRNWMESNQRHGPYELFVWVFWFAIFYSVMRHDQSVLMMKSVLANSYYPGRHFIRSYGEPKDWEKEKFWWQEPLETFPNQGEVWYYNEIRYKYINHVKKQENEEKLKAALAV